MNEYTQSQHTRSTSLAIERTYLAHERTLMAWIRTATSLITFGFALYKFFFYLNDVEGNKLHEQILGPRGYGLVMIGIGIFTLVVATVQHRLFIKTLRSEYQDIPISLATIIAGLIATLGVFAFVATVFRE